MLSTLNTLEKFNQIHPIGESALPRKYSISLQSRDLSIDWYCSEVVLEKQWMNWCGSVLSAEERERCENYAFDWLSAQYCSSRGALRYVLSEFTGKAASHIAFRRGPYGKPVMEAGDGAFNFSDSGNHWAACMHRSADIEMGIDIEVADKFDNANAGLRKAIFSAEESAAWEHSPPTSAATALATIWTRKEALLKAVGTGLSMAMCDFTVGWAPQLPQKTQSIHLPNIAGQSTCWYVHDLPSLPHGLVGSLAVNAA
jgi:4'-phosphopantetheinyl transferase